MEGGIGTSYEVGPGRAATPGELNGPFVYGEGKVEAMRKFAAEHDIDLDESYAYSDSASDMPMLRAVGNPVVVNPDEALLEVAKAEGWRVLRFERLGRKLAIVGATALAAAVGGSGRALRPPPRGPPAAQHARALSSVGRTAGSRARALSRTLRSTRARRRPRRRRSQPAGRGRPRRPRPRAPAARPRPGRAR